MSVSCEQKHNVINTSDIGLVAVALSNGRLGNYNVLEALSLFVQNGDEDHKNKGDDEARDPDDDSVDLIHLICGLRRQQAI